jgi:hypothetical protein
VATANNQLRDRLRAIREQVNDARARRAPAQRERDAAKEAFASADLDGQRITEAPEFRAAEEAVRALGTIDDELADLGVAERGVLQMLGDAVGAPDAGGNDRGSIIEMAQSWDGRQLLATEGSRYQQARDMGVFTSTSQFGSVQLGEIASRELVAEFLAALPAAPAGPVGRTNMLGATPADRRGIIAPLLRPLSLLDLIPVGTTDSNSVEYVQVTAVPGGAAETVEGAVKPEAGLTTVDATAPVRTIAGWVKLLRQALDDISGLATLINTLLPYDVRRRIENQILSGDGVGQNLRGVLNTTGIGAPDAVDGDNPADAILRAMTAVILSDGDPNFVAANPLTWQSLRLMREDDTARTGQYLYGSPGALAAPTIWGLALTANRTVPEATPLVGDANGATLLVREGVNVKVSDSDQDDFVRNRVTVLAEARVAFPIWRPASFAVATTAPVTP